MSISYNKKYKGQILRQENQKNKLEEQKQKQLLTPNKNTINKRNTYSTQLPSGTQQELKQKLKLTQQQQPKNNKLRSKRLQTVSDQQYQQNGGYSAKNNIGVKEAFNKQSKSKAVSRKQTKNKTEIEETSENEDNQQMTVQSNNRNTGKAAQKDKNITVQLMSKSNNRRIGKQPTHAQQQNNNNGNKYLFYNNNRKVAKEQIANEQVNDNQFMNQIQQRSKLSKYSYKKHAHEKGEDKKQRLVNKLGFIFDLANKDQIASVSYYSETNSQSSLHNKDNQQIRQVQVPPKKATIQKDSQQNNQKVKEAVCHEDKQKQPQITKINQPIKQKQQPKIVKKIKQQNQKESNNRWKQLQENKKENKANTFEIKLHEVNLQKPVRIYQTPKRLEQRNISSMQTVKKEVPLSYQSKYKIVNPQIKKNTFSNNKDVEEDELLALIKKNDQYLEEYKILKYPKNYFQSPRKEANFHKRQDFGQQRRRIKTDLDYRNEQFSPLSEQQKVTLARLKARQEQLMKRIRYQFYHNPSVLYTNDSQLQPQPSQNHQEDNPHFNQIKQLSPSSNTYEISRVLPLMGETFRPKKSEILQHYPLSLKNYQKPNYLNNQLYRQNENKYMTTQKKVQNSQDFKYMRKDVNKQQNSKNIYLLSRNDKDYKILNPRQKYERIKNLLQRV